MQRVVVISLMLLFGTLAAHALDFTQPVLQLDGTAVTSPDGKTPVTLETVCEVALLSQYQDESNLSGDDKVKRYALALEIYNKKKADLSAEDIALLKKLIAKAYSPLIVGQAYKMLDPAASPK